MSSEIKVHSELCGTSPQSSSFLVSKLEKQADKSSVYVRMQSDLVLWKLLTASQTQPTQRDRSY